MTGIYVIENLLNGKKYVGQAENIGHRWTVHISRVSNNSDRNELIYTAIRKYGIENFSFKVIEECSIDKLDEREAYWISKYNTYVYNPNSHGYNVTPGGSSTRKITDEAINHVVQLWDQGLTIGEIHKEVKFCNETIVTILKEHSSSYSSEESSLRTIIREVGPGIRINQYNVCCELVGSYPSIAEAAKTVNMDRNSLYKHLDFKTKVCGGYIFVKSNENQKESLIKHLDMISGKDQPVMQFNDTGNFITCYNTLKLAAEQNNISPKSIRKSCYGEIYSTKGYHWEYLNSSLFNYINFISPTPEQEEQLIYQHYNKEGYAEEKFK